MRNTILVASCAVAIAATGLHAAPVAAVDSMGRRLSLPAPAVRIVSASPAATEALFAVGAGPSVVGDTTYCDYPEAALALPKIGGFVGETVSVERIVALKPDLVVTAGFMHAGLEASLKKLGIPIFAYDPADFVGIADSMMALGALAGAPDSAIKAAAALTGSIKRIKDATARLSSTQRPAVFWEVYDEPLMTCGSSSFPHAIIEAAGGRDLFGDVVGPWPQVSAEEVLRRAPTIIISPDDMGEKVNFARLVSKPGWAAIPAVRDKRVYLVPADLVSRAGPRIAAGILAVARILHPELFP